MGGSPDRITGLRLVRLTHRGRDEVDAQFSTDAGDIESTFRLARNGPAIGAAPSPDIFWRSDIGANEVRAIVAAVVSFCLAAQGEAP